jgi:hypothetical protein
MRLASGKTLRGAIVAHPAVRKTDALTKPIRNIRRSNVPKPTTRGFRSNG